MHKFGIALLAVGALSCLLGAALATSTPNRFDGGINWGKLRVGLHPTMLAWFSDATDGGTWHTSIRWNRTAGIWVSYMSAEHSAILDEPDWWSATDIGGRLHERAKVLTAQDNRRAWHWPHWQ